MKKIVAIASAAVLGLSLAACDSTAENQAEAEIDASEDAANAQIDAMEESVDATTDAQEDAIDAVDPATPAEADTAVQ